MEVRVIPELHLDDVSLGDRVPDSGQLGRKYRAEILRCLQTICWG